MAEIEPQVALPSTLVIGGRVVDGRRLEAKRYKALCQDLASDLGRDPSTAEWLLIGRAAAAAVQLEALEAQALTGAEVDPDVFVKLSSAMRHLLQALGVARRPKDVTGKVTVLDSHTRALLEPQEG